MKKPNKESIIMFIAGVLSLGVGIPVSTDGNAFGLAAAIFGISFVIMSFGWKDDED